MRAPTQTPRWSAARCFAGSAPARQEAFWPLLSRRVRFKVQGRDLKTTCFNLYNTVVDGWFALSRLYYLTQQWPNYSIIVVLTVFPCLLQPFWQLCSLAPCGPLRRKSVFQVATSLASPASSSVLSLVANWSPLSACRVFRRSHRSLVRLCSPAVV